MWHAVLTTTGRPGLDETVAGVRVVDISHPATLALAFSAGDEPIVVVAPANDLAATRVAVSFLHAHRPDRRVAVLSSSHAPLALLVAASSARRLAVDAGHGASVWRDLAATAWSGAVVGSVTRLDHPNPTLRQHVRSWFPGSRFLVRQQPDPLTVDVGALLPAFAGLARKEYDLVVAPPGHGDPLTAELVSLLAPGSVRELPVPGDWSSLYGQPEDFQVAAFPTDPRPRLRPAARPCRGCGLAAGEPTCDFCRTRTSEPVRSQDWESLLDDPLPSAGRTP